MRHYTLADTEKAIRLDQFLTRTEPAHSRAFLQKLIKDGAVFVNHKKITKAGHKLAAGDELLVLFPSLKDIGIQPEKIPLEVVYEDKDMLVVNKPAGMVVHPTDHGARVSGTLVNALLHYCKDLSGIGGEKRPGLVHRLDKDTSGLIMIAKHDAAHRGLAAQIEARTVTKKYITLLKGHLTPATGSVEAPLLDNPHLKEVRVSGSVRAKYALTHYKVIETVGDCSLVEVRIVTGRTHQIRVHFAAIGHPVCGDGTYGDKAVNEKLAGLGLTRQFLHAAELEVKQPVTGTVLHLKAALPAELKAVLKRLKK